MPKFCGGTSTDSHGYLKLTSGPLRGKRVHILVAEAMLGRKLLPTEQVHHRNLNKKDPSPGNLKIVDIKEHGAVSNRQAWFLKNRERAELAWWQEWIEMGGIRPDMVDGYSGEPPAPDSTASAANAETSFNPEEFTNGTV